MSAVRRPILLSGIERSVIQWVRGVTNVDGKLRVALHPIAGLFSDFFMVYITHGLIPSIRGFASIENTVACYGKSS